MKYSFDEDKKQLFCALVILDALVDKQAHFSVYDQKLLLIFQRMIEKDLITVKNNEYITLDKGNELIENFYQRYQEFIKLYDLYCAVDLEAGEFAFEKILDMSEEDFQKYIDDKRWDDVRVAVCEFKKIDPMQMIFLSFLREGDIDIEKKGWEDILLNDDMWNEICEICNTAITSEQLSVDDQLLNIVTRGTELLKTLLEREKEESVNQTETVTTTEETVEETVDDLDYYDPYFYDPYYISPCWGFYYETPYYW